MGSPASPNRDRFAFVAFDEQSDAERELSRTVEATIAKATSVLHAPSAQLKATTNVNFQRANSVLRANGVRITSDQAEESMSPADQRHEEAEALLRTQLESCRDLLRRVDGERRHVHKQYTRLQREYELRRVEMKSVRRYSTEAHNRSLVVDRHVSEERARRKKLEEELDAQTQEVMRLRRVLRALPADTLSTLSPRHTPSAPGSPKSATLLALAPDRRFEEAFRDKMQSIVFKRRYRQAGAMHQATSEQLEALMMEQHDPMYVTAGWPFALESGIGSAAEGASVVTDGSAAPRRRASASLGPSFVESASFAFANTLGEDSMGTTVLATSAVLQSALDFPFQLPFTTATPQDAYIKFLVYNSAYAEPLNQLREHVLRLSSRLKTAQDGGLRALYTVFMQTLRQLGDSARHTQWRTLFERQMEKMQRTHRELLYGLVEQVNTAATRIPELERGGGSGSAAMAALRRESNSTVLQRRDVGCSAQESSTMEEYRASQLKDQLAALKANSLQTITTAQREQGRMSHERAVARRDAVQAVKSLKSLARCIVTSLWAQSGAVGSADAVTDPFVTVHEPVTENVLDDPRLGTKLAEATELTISYVRLLARNSAGCGDRIGSAQRRRTSSSTAMLSSTQTSETDRGSGEDGSSHAVDIVSQRPSITAASRPPRSQLAPRRTSSSGHEPLLRSRSRSRSATTRWTAEARRSSAPQLPHVAAAPSSPRVHSQGGAGYGGRRRLGSASAVSVPKQAGTSSSGRFVVHPSVGADGPSQSTVAVIALDFHGSNV